MTSSTVGARTADTIRDLLICPITHQLLQDPVIDKCGHTFERTDIIAWLEGHPVCPLSRQVSRVADLRPNHAIKDVLDVLAHHSAELATLEEDEATRVDEGINLIATQRAADAAAGVPDRLAEPLPSLAARVRTGVAECIRRVYC